MTFYPGLRTVAIQLIDEFGQSATIIRATDQDSPSTFDPAASKEPRTQVGVRFVQDSATISDQAQSVIEDQDVSGFISVEGIIDAPIKKQDDFMIGVLTYRFKWLKALNPGGVKLLYEFVAQR